MATVKVTAAATAMIGPRRGADPVAFCNPVSSRFRTRCTDGTNSEPHEMSTQATPRRDTSSMTELFARGDFQDEFTDQLGALISALRRELVRRTASSWTAGELSAAQVELLLAVERRPAISVREAADRLSLAPNTISTLVRQLTGRGLMLREQDAEDRRVASLTISADAARRFAE